MKTKDKGADPNLNGWYSDNAGFKFHYSQGECNVMNVEGATVTLFPVEDGWELSISKLDAHNENTHTVWMKVSD